MATSPLMVSPDSSLFLVRQLVLLSVLIRLYSDPNKQEKEAFPHWSSFVWGVNTFAAFLQ
jgi:hypothetical protein